MNQFRTVSLNEITAKIGSGATPRGGESVYKTSGISLIRSQNVYDFEFKADGLAFIDEEQADKLANVEIQSGDLLLNITGDSIGRCCIVPDEWLPARVNQHVSIIRANEYSVPRFLLYYLNAPRNKTDLLNRVHGGTRRALTKGIIESFEIDLPPLPTQQRIAEILGRLDDKIEANRRINRTLEQMAQALYKHWFVDFGPFQDGEFVESELGLIPAGWKVGKLGDLCEKPQYGYTESAKDEPVGPRFLRIADINKQPWIEWESVPFCPIDPTNFEKYRVQVGDILIARMADPGHGVLIEEEIEAVFASYLIRFVPLNPIFDRYIQYWLRSREYWGLVESRKAGTTRANLNAPQLGGMPILIPPESIVGSYRNVIANHRKIVVHNVSENAKLAAIRDYLLPRLLSGGLVVG